MDFTVRQRTGQGRAEANRRARIRPKGFQHFLSSYSIMLFAHFCRRGSERTSPTSLTSFYHPSFRKGHPELLSQIQRKTPDSSNQNKDSGLRDLVTSLQGEVAELRQQNEDLFKIQQRILYIFSRYMRATQTAQVGNGSNSSQQGGQQQDSSNKRIRASNQREEGNKRQRLLIESKPDTPPSDYQLDTSYASRDNGGYHEKTTAEYFGTSSTQPSSSNAANSHDPNNQVLDLNTDTYYGPHSTGYNNLPHREGDGIYGHSLSDLNWSSDPVQAINELIQKSGQPLQQVLNSSTSLPMQMGRAGASQAVMNAAANGQPFVVDSNNFGNASFGSNDYSANPNNLHLYSNRRARGGGNSNAGLRNINNNGGGGDLLDLGTQLAHSNPKQLLELLDRMGNTVDAAANDSTSARNNMVTASTRPRHGGGAITTSNSSNTNYGMAPSHAISGVFEDADEPLTTRPFHGAPSSATSSSTLTSSLPLLKQRESPRSAQIDSIRVKDEPSNNSFTSFIPPSISTAAHLSPLDDESSFPLKPVNSSSNSPPLNSLPLPTSPVSPFVPLDGTPAHPTYELRSPMHNDPLSLSRATSQNPLDCHADPIPFTVNSPYQGAINIPDIQPLTPINDRLI